MYEVTFKPKNFILQELVCKEIYLELGENAWGLLDPNALKALQLLRDSFGALTVNNWHRGGQYNESGLRQQNTSTGAPKSAHKIGKAFDVKSKFYSPREMMDSILANTNKFVYIRRIESTAYTPTWLHIDTVEHDGTGIRIFNP